MFKSFLLALCIVLVPAFVLGQEPNHRRLRHSKKVVKLEQAAVAAPAFVANAVDFDGTTDFLNRGSDLTGGADGKKGLISVWVRIDGGDGNLRAIVRANGNDHRLVILADNKVRYDAENVSDTDILLLQSTGTFTASSAWIHILASWDLNTPEAHLFVDGVNVEDTGVSIAIDDTIDYTTPDHGVGGTSSGGQLFSGCISEFYDNTAEFLDITVEANRLKFRSAAGKPVDLGPTGNLPTTNDPIIYLNGDSTNFEINQGTGGNFNVTGSLTACSTSPTD